VCWASVSSPQNRMGRPNHRILDFLNRSIFFSSVIMKLQLLSVLISFLVGLVFSNPTATIDSGVIIGTTTALPGATAAVNKFLGMPFAAKPLGKRRFALPQSVPKWKTALKTQKWSPACVQQFNCMSKSMRYSFPLLMLVARPRGCA
jgi:hypothetical protein